MHIFILTDLCNTVRCREGYECLIYEDSRLREAYCSPNCEDLNPCGPQEQCVITDVNCIRAPCPGVLSCEGTSVWLESSSDCNIDLLNFLCCVCCCVVVLNPMNNSSDLYFNFLCMLLLQGAVQEGKSGRSVVPPAPSHVTTIPHHLAAHGSVCEDVFVLGELFYMKEDVLPSLIALIISVCL